MEGDILLQENTKTQRIDWIDCLKGFGMICVVLGHLAPFFPVEKLIYSFHMPLFFFLSGIVTKDKKQKLSAVLKKSVSALLVPFVIWDILSLIVSLVMMNDDVMTCILRALFIGGLHSWNAPIWFLLVLFQVKILYGILHRSHIPDWLTLIFMTAVSFFVSGLDTLPFMLNLVPVAMVFFLTGVALRKVFIDKKWDAFQNKMPVKVTAAGISLLVLSVFGAVLNDRISFTGAAFGNYLYFYLGALGGILFFCILFSVLPCLKILKQIGRESMFIMCFQYWILWAADRVSNALLKFSVWHYRNTIKALVMTAAVIAICLFITFLCRKLLRKFPKLRPLLSPIIPV